MEKMCPYIESRTVQKTIIQYNDDMQETGNVQIYERTMMECNEKCMKLINGICTYKD